MSDAEELHAVAQELPAILDVVAEKVPALIRGLAGVFFSESAGRELGNAVAAFYEALKERGLPEEMIKEMTREYLNTQTAVLAKAAQGMNLNMGGKGAGKEDAG